MTKFSSLAERLPPDLKAIDHWREFFEAVDEVIEQRITPESERTMSLRSPFTADPRDLDLIMAELSGYFDEASRENAKPLSPFWKRVETRNKNTVFAVEAMLQRINIPATDIEYIPLYCAKDLDYGETFVSRQELEESGADLDEYFLTSHVDLRTDFNRFILYGWDRDEAKLVLERYFEESVRPTHIVFRGLQFYIRAVEYRGNYVSVASRPRRVIMSKMT